LYGGWALSRNLKENLGVFRLKWLAKILSSTLLMLATLIGLKMIMPYPVSNTVGLRALWLIGMILAGIALYSVCTILLSCSEWQWIKDALKQKKKTTD
jgi:hypothetical protein